MQTLSTTSLCRFLLLPCEPYRRKETGLPVYNAPQRLYRARELNGLTTPVIHEDHAEDALVGFLYGDGLPQVGTYLQKRLACQSMTHTQDTQG